MPPCVKALIAAPRFLLLTCCSLDGIHKRKCSSAGKNGYTCLPGGQIKEQSKLPKQSCGTAGFWLWKWVLRLSPALHKCTHSHAPAPRPQGRFSKGLLGRLHSSLPSILLCSARLLMETTNQQLAMPS